jgi:hypothetical protein
MFTSFFIIKVSGNCYNNPMPLLDNLEQKYSRFAPTDTTIYLVVGQVIAFVLSYISPQYYNYLPLTGLLVLHGEIWRLVTFLFIPLTSSIIFAAFTWYFYYLIGTALENHWGAFRYLVYLFICYLGNLIVAFLFPLQPVTNVFLFTSLFLAFAYLFPDETFLIFFILPVKAKWLGIIAWLGLAGSFLAGDLPTKVLVLVSIINFLIFFGEDVYLSFKHGGILKNPIPKGILPSGQRPLHKTKTCAICSKTQDDYPDMEFRFCPLCGNNQRRIYYCEDHLREHIHKS